MRDAANEERRELYKASVGEAIESIEANANRLPQEAVLVGMSVKLAGDCLVTLRAVIAREKRVIAFVGGATMGAALLKADQMLRGGLVVWKADQFS